jgi:HSP20 family protein
MSPQSGQKQEHGQAVVVHVDPFQELDQPTEEIFGPVIRVDATMRDVYFEGDRVYLKLDLPGVKPDSIDLTLEQNVLTVRGERLGPEGDVEPRIVEHSARTFTHQIFLDKTLDAGHIDADYTEGVLTLSFPMLGVTKPLRVAISIQAADQVSTASHSKSSDSTFNDQVQAARRNRELINKLARWRAQHGPSQAEVAKRMHTSQPAIARLESHQHDAQLSTLARYVAALGLSLHFVLADSGTLAPIWTSREEELQRRKTRAQERPNVGGRR